MDSAMASTACRACWAVVVPDKIGRQEHPGMASSGSVIRPARIRSPYKPAPGAGLPCTTSLTPPPCELRRGVFLRGRPCRRPARNGDQAAHIHVRCLIPPAWNCSASNYYAFGLRAARRLGVRAAIWSSVRRLVGTTLGATDDQGQFLLVECPQSLLGQC